MAALSAFANTGKNLEFEDKIYRLRTTVKPCLNLQGFISEQLQFSMHSRKIMKIGNLKVPHSS